MTESMRPLIYRQEISPDFKIASGHASAAIQE